MPVSRHPPKRKLQLSLLLLPSTKFQTEPEYHLIGKILPLSNTWLQGCPVVCSQVHYRKSKAKIFQAQGKAGRNHSTAWPLQERCCYVQLQPKFLHNQSPAEMLLQPGKEVAGTQLGMSVSSKAFRPPKLLFMHSITPVKTSQNLLSMSNLFWMNTAELVGSLHYKQLNQVGFKTSLSWSQCKSSVWGRGEKTASCSTKQHSQTTSTLQAVPVGVVAGSVVPAPELYWLIVQLYPSDPLDRLKARLEGWIYFSQPKMLQQNLLPFRILKQLTCRHSPFLTISFSFSSSKASMVFTCFSFPFNLCHWTQTHSINPLLFRSPENKTPHALQHLTKAASVIKKGTSTIQLLKINVWTLHFSLG